MPGKLAFACPRGTAAAFLVRTSAGLNPTRPGGKRPSPQPRAATATWSTARRTGRPVVGQKAVSPGEWLRDHSDPDDLVATNSHCRLVYRGNCDNRHFWISAYSERRVLIESWGYTVTALAALEHDKTFFYFIPYWRGDLLADNDRAFRAPSEETIGTLRNKYGVKWLFVDERFDEPAPHLGRFAKLRFRRDDSSVYELTP